MESKILFSLIIILLGFGYLGVTIFMHKKKTVPIGVPGIPIFWMIKKEKHKKYSLFFLIYNIIMSFVIILFGAMLLIQ
jgi:hypothetical protein